MSIKLKSHLAHFFVCNRLCKFFAFLLLNWHQIDVFRLAHEQPHVGRGILFKVDVELNIEIFVPALLTNVLVEVFKHFSASQAAVTLCSVLLDSVFC